MPLATVVMKCPSGTAPDLRPGSQKGQTRPRPPDALALEQNFESTEPHSAVETPPEVTHYPPPASLALLQPSPSSKSGPRISPWLLRKGPHMYLVQVVGSQAPLLLNGEPVGPKRTKVLAGSQVPGNSLAQEAPAAPQGPWTRFQPKPGILSPPGLSPPGCSSLIPRVPLHVPDCTHSSLRPVLDTPVLTSTASPSGPSKFSPPLEAVLSQPALREGGIKACGWRG